MQIVPLHDNVVILPEEEEKKTKFGIVLPESSKGEKKQIGEVIAVGPGKKDQKMSIKKGDRVLYPQYAGDEIEIDGVEYKIVSEERILGVLTK